MPVPSGLQGKASTRRDDERSRRNHGASPQDRPHESGLSEEVPAVSSERERRALFSRFQGRVKADSGLTSKVVSYQGNYSAPGLRWMKYREGFSRELIEKAITDYRPESLLDPFCGIGTAPLVAAGRGLRATGIELAPVGLMVGRGIALASNGLEEKAFANSASELLDHVNSSSLANPEHCFPHIKITSDAFPPETEVALARAREFISQVDDPSIKTMLNLACMTVLEDVSFTRKDGQYLRWDPRSGKGRQTKPQKTVIHGFQDAIQQRIAEMEDDIEPLKGSYGVKGSYGGRIPDLVNASSLDHLREIPSSSFDMVVTSPPYANRYDYTRTYALELAWLGYSDGDVKRLRQRMLSATVENKSKLGWLQSIYGRTTLLDSAIQMYERQGALHEVINQLKLARKDLSNPHIIRMLEGYFLEMAVTIAELGRIVRPGGTVIMVNDNVQYHGEELPVDLILSDFAEQSGFVCEHIWVQPRAKGNASQQMGRFGRRQQRKCVYTWVRR